MKNVQSRTGDLSPYGVDVARPIYDTGPANCECQFAGKENLLTVVTAEPVAEKASRRLSRHPVWSAVAMRALPR